MVFYDQLMRNNELILPLNNNQVVSIKRNKIILRSSLKNIIDYLHTNRQKLFYKWSDQNYQTQITYVQYNIIKYYDPSYQIFGETLFIEFDNKKSLMKYQLKFS